MLNKNFEDDFLNPVQRGTSVELLELTTPRFQTRTNDPPDFKPDWRRNCDLCGIAFDL